MELDRLRGRDKKTGTRLLKRYGVCERGRDLVLSWQIAEYCETSTLDTLELFGDYASA